MNQYNEKGQMHGPWEKYWNGKLWCRVIYKNGKKHGLWEYYSISCQQLHRGEYLNDIPIGFWIVNDKNEFYL